MIGILIVALALQTRCVGDLVERRAAGERAKARYLLVRRARRCGDRRRRRGHRVRDGAVVAADRRRGARILLAAITADLRSVARRRGARSYGRRNA